MIWKQKHPRINLGFAIIGRGRFAWRPKRCDDGYTVWLAKPWVVIRYNYPILGVQNYRGHEYAWTAEYIAGLLTNAEARAAMLQKRCQDEHDRHARILGPL